MLAAAPVAAIGALEADEPARPTRPPTDVLPVLPYEGHLGVHVPRPAADCLWPCGQTGGPAAVRDVDPQAPRGGRIGVATLAAMDETRSIERAGTLRRPVPGALFPWVKLASYVELGLFAALLVFWLLPGFEGETFVFGLSHGIGFIALCLLIWIAVLRREAPYWLLAATLTPVGPVGSVIGIGFMERRSDHTEGTRVE
jgi:hypothetical protein